MTKPFVEKNVRKAFATLAKKTISVELFSVYSVEIMGHLL